MDIVLIRRIYNHLEHSYLTYKLSQMYDKLLCWRNKSNCVCRHIRISLSLKQTKTGHTFTIHTLYSDKFKGTEAPEQINSNFSIRLSLSSMSQEPWTNSLPAPDSEWNSNEFKWINGNLWTWIMDSNGILWCICCTLHVLIKRHISHCIYI